MGVDDLAKPPITARKLLYQALLDWTGKEVQTGYTYTYVWMANQLGHFTLGFLPSALSFWLVDVIAGGLRQNRPWLLQFGLPLAIAVLLGLFWLWKEIDDIRRCTATAASSYFAASFDRTSVFLDAATAVGFIWIGIAVGDIGYWWPRWAIAALLAGAVIALAPAGTGCASVSVSSSPDCRWCTGSPSFRAASIRPASPRCARCAPARPGTWPSLAASAPARARSRPPLAPSSPSPSASCAACRCSS